MTIERRKALPVTEFEKAEVMCPLCSSVAKQPCRRVKKDGVNIKLGAPIPTMHPQRRKLAKMPPSANRAGVNRAGGRTPEQQARAREAAREKFGSTGCRKKRTRETADVECPICPALAGQACLWLPRGWVKGRRNRKEPGGQLFEIHPQRREQQTTPRPTQLPPAAQPASPGPG